MIEVEVVPTSWIIGLTMSDSSPTFRRSWSVWLLVRYVPRTSGGGTRGPSPTNLEWVLQLRHVVDDLDRGLLHVARHPIRGLVREVVSIRAERVRRVDPHMRAAIRRGTGGGPFVRVNDHLVVRQKLEEQRAQPTLDTSEHRRLSVQIDRIRRRLAWLRRQEAATELTDRRRKSLHELAEVERRMTRLGRLEPLIAAQGHAPPGFASLQLMGAPGYGEAYHACLALTLGLRITDGPMQVSVKDLSLLYEYWCYLALLRLVAEETGHPIDPHTLLNISQQGLRVLLRKGHQTRVPFKDQAGRTIEVCYNPKFGSSNYNFDSPDPGYARYDRRKANLAENSLAPRCQVSCRQLNGVSGSVRTRARRKTRSMYCIVIETPS